jgi:hypothetical protein
MYNQATISALLLWNADNDNKIGLSDRESEQELQTLIKEGLDPLEFVTEEELEPYM